ncbi:MULTISPECIES: CS1 type fimbrial major subunit [Burkholderia]|uniref:Fimbrial assembly protein n=1 Tax=Burkholderia contaminans TaxID=488447 RepID=A0A2S5E3U6_9BURK|nr:MULTISPECIES: CS1 type fimbrial major subunit [Burkholderia]EKS9798742.1 fimbrial assembly protein [Burkholderia cepacia]EKS9803166.1 fimbrial assembly protein [Burkholderia cepacia]EKS9810650.1 fimbrial assembly protein [Burkholderia cepacia]EKS9819619.1 fimbrial assembly protein [Burkholderia cepacia]EKS9827237.1 fimbrial assembly protein [Burkholderia cepacia]
MKLSKLVLAMGVTAALFGMAHTAQADTVSKKVTLTAQINDGIFVSKPDGTTWYTTEELAATDYTQTKFATSLPVRVWSKNASFNVSLAQPLKLSSGKYEMKNAKVMIGSTAGDAEVKFGAVQKVTQTVAGNGGYDEVHDVKINVEAPTKVGTLSTNGSYSGDLVMVFEPVAASGS